MQKKKPNITVGSSRSATFVVQYMYIYIYIYICGNPPSRNDKIVCVLKLSHGWVQGGGHTYTHINTYQFLPVVQHKAAAEVSKIGNYRRGALL